METIREANVLDKYVEDMQIHAIAVNRRQSVPDWKDGLKSVARRVLTTMYDQNLLYNKPRVKCAGVVGNCMAQYHPHSDCLQSSTRLYTLGGNRITIEEATNLHLPYLDILSVDIINGGRVVPARATNFRIGQYTNTIYHVILSNGADVKCTSNHPFLNGYGEYIKAEDLKPFTRLYCKQLKLTDDKPSIKDIYDIECLYVTDIYTEDVDNEPMYDFTVDIYENMLIPVSDSDSDTIPMIAVHNSGTYEVMTLMSRWWDCKVPLLDGHGNFGNMQGDDAAAMRYTETRLSEFATDVIISDLLISKDIVDWVPNYNDSGKEPEYLPAKLPLLLINGTFGIGVGMRAEVSRHNITEVIDATLKLLENPNAKVVLIPDHCQPCDIIDTDWKTMCNTGFGTYRCRGRIDIETDKHGYPLLIIKSVPDMVTLFKPGVNEDEGVIANVNKMIKEGKLSSIKDHWDESSKEEMRYVIQLNKGSNPSYIRDFLYKSTQLEKPFRTNMELLDGIDCVRFSYKSYLEAFIIFSRENKYRYYYARLSDAKTKWREKQLYLKVMNSGDIKKIQADIRKRTDISAKANNEFREYLIATYKVTDIEADFIMHMDMMKCSEGYRVKYEEECRKLEEEINLCMTHITDQSIIDSEIKDDLLYFREKYKRPRVCRVIKVTDDIPEGDFMIVITENNFIKKLNPGDNINSYRGDSPKLVLKVENKDNLLLFDSKGKVFRIPVHKLDTCDKNSSGYDLRVINKYITSDIISIMTEERIKAISLNVSKSFMVVLTSQGYIKKMDLDDFLNITMSGAIYTKLANIEDSVKDITIIPDGYEVVIFSSRRALRIPMEAVPHYKKTAQGVLGVETEYPIEGLAIIKPSTQYIVVITIEGRINKFLIEGLTLKKRRQAMNSIIKLGKEDKIHSIYGVTDEDTLKVYTKLGVKEFPIGELKIGSTASGGLDLIATKGQSILRTSIKK